MALVALWYTKLYKLIDILKQLTETYLLIYRKENTLKFNLESIKFCNYAL